MNLGLFMLRELRDEYPPNEPTMVVFTLTRENDGMAHRMC